jgi:hypothetical protein
VLLLRRRRESLSGLWIVGLFGALLAPLAIHQMSYGHAEWISNFSLGHRVWEATATFVVGETGDIIGRVEQPGPALIPLALVGAALLLLVLRGRGEERGAAAIPLALAAAGIGIPLLSALVPGGKDFVLARNLLPALLPLLTGVAVALTVERARRLGGVLAALLLAYSLGFCIWASTSPDLQRPDWEAVAERMDEPDGPRATVTWVIGAAPLRFYLTDGAVQRKPSDGAIQVKPSEGYDWLVREVSFVSMGSAPPPPQRLIGPRFREVAYEQVGELFIRRYRVPGPELAPLRLRTLPRADTNFRNNTVLLDGIGPD